MEIIKLMFREGVLGDEFGLDKASWIEPLRLNPSGFIRSQGLGVGLPAASRCPVPPWDSARKKTINKYGSSDFFLQNSEWKETSILYKVAFFSYFAIVRKALRETERHPQQACSDRLRSAS